MLHKCVTVMLRYNHCCTGTNCEDVACAGQDYVAIVSPVLVGLVAVVMQYDVFS
jgi:hypothetical protein